MFIRKPKTPLHRYHFSSFNFLDISYKICKAYFSFVEKEVLDSYLLLTQYLNQTITKKVKLG